MTPAECVAAVKRLNLQKTNQPNVGRDSNGVMHSIPVWEKYSPIERLYLLKRLTVAVRGFDREEAEGISSRPT
jgi:hypothetical protein